MDPEHPDLEARITELERTLHAIEARTAALEGRLAKATGLAGMRIPTPEFPAAESGIGPGRGPAVEQPVASPARESLLALAGRSLIALAGAFLIRATTESGAVPQLAGSLLGIAYALLWLGFAHRAAGQGRSTGALFHGMVSLAIAYPLLWEATVKFKFLSPPAAAIGLWVVTTAGLAVAWHRSRMALGWLIAVGTGSTALGLAFATQTFVPFVASQLLLGLTLLWIGYSRGWYLLATVAGGIVDFTLFVLTGLVILQPESTVLHDVRPTALILLQFGAVVAYLASFSYQVLVRGRSIHALEILQTLILLAVGLGGAIWVSLTGKVHIVPVGLAILALCVAAYSVAFAFVDRRLERRQNFIFYSTIALALALLSLGGLLSGALRSLTFSFLAVAMAAFGAYRQRATLSLHGSLYALAAAGFSGLLRTGSGALFFGGADVARWTSLPLWVALGAILGCLAFPVPLHGRTWGRLSRTPRVVLWVLAAIGLGGWFVSALAGILPGSEEGPDPALLAALRTAILSATAILMAWLGRGERWREIGWLVIPLLVLTGAKLLLQDVRAGRSATLFLSLAVYGIALLVAPRLLRRTPT